MTDTSRRAFVTAAAVTAAAIPAAAQEAKKPGAPTAPNAAAYPKPPFTAQQQPWPGLASQMTPRPDHGETSYKGSGKLAGKRALITGGDSGLGRATAIAYAREGADVAICYHPREESDAKTVIGLIEAEGRKAVALPADIREEKAARQVVDDAVKALGGLEVLVLNAGMQQSQDSIADITTEQFDATMKTNIYAPFWMAQQALPHLKKGASIIVTSSINAYSPSKNLLDYSMTKAADKTFAQVLAKQLAPKGIRVNAVAPGPFWTALQVSGGQPKEDLRPPGEALGEGIDGNQRQRGDPQQHRGPVHREQDQRANGQLRPQPGQCPPQRDLPRGQGARAGARHLAVDVAVDVDVAGAGADGDGDAGERRGHVVGAQAGEAPVPVELVTDERDLEPAKAVQQIRRDRRGARVLLDGHATAPWRRSATAAAIRATPSSRVSSEVAIDRRK